MSNEGLTPGAVEASAAMTVLLRVWIGQGRPA